MQTRKTLFGKQWLTLQIKGRQPTFRVPVSSKPRAHRCQNKEERNVSKISSFCEVEINWRFSRWPSSLITDSLISRHLSSTFQLIPNFRLLKLSCCLIKLNVEYEHFCLFKNRLFHVQAACIALLLVRHL